jgi:hypothetical protein
LPDRDFHPVRDTRLFLALHDSAVLPWPALYEPAT